MWTVVWGLCGDRVLLDGIGIGIGSGAAPGTGDEAGGSSRAVLRQTRTIRDAIVGGVLKEREGELAAMAHFCADPDASYLIWDADEWSGASSLLATFVAEPPASVDVVAFVVDGGDAQARTADRFLAAVAAQLEEYLGVPREGSVPAAPGAARARYEPLLREASAAARTAGRHLVLIVDALDEEDVDFTGLEPITTLLGARVPGLHVIAAMRPDGPAAELAREDDTLCEVVPVELAPFLDGAQLRRAAGLGLQPRRRDDVDEVRRQPGVELDLDQFP